MPEAAAETMPSQRASLEGVLRSNFFFVRTRISAALGCVWRGAAYPMSGPSRGASPSTRALGMSVNRDHMQTRVVDGTLVRKRELVCLRPSQVCGMPSKPTPLGNSVLTGL